MKAAMTLLKIPMLIVPIFLVHIVVPIRLWDLLRFLYISGVTARVKPSTCSSSFDTKIQVFQERFIRARLICVGGDDDSCSPGSEFTFLAVWSETYIIHITGFRFSEGSFQLSVGCSPIHASDSGDI